MPTSPPDDHGEPRSEVTVASRDGRSERARTALVDAAARLLAERSPSAITGRGLAAEAGVNYGLVHHYFGGKDALLSAGLAALRDDFLAVHGDVGSLHLITGGTHPYLRALIRSQVDYPSSVPLEHDFPVGSALVDAIAGRMTARRGEMTDRGGAEAKARAIALVSIQLCYGVFGAALLDATGVGHRQRSSVESALAALYDTLALVDPGT